VQKDEVAFSGGVNVYGRNVDAVRALITELKISDIKQTSGMPFPHPRVATAPLEDNPNLRDAVLVQVGPKPDLLEEKRMREMADMRAKDPHFRGTFANEMNIPQ